jgi:guanylate kinase
MKKQFKKIGQIFVISSPSGGGKTTLVAILLKRLPSIYRSVSVTTRPPRKGEKNGRDYQFISVKKFEQLKKSSGLIEWARVHQAFYGTPKSKVEELLLKGKDVILAIDVQGAYKIKEAFRHHATLIFVMPPSLQELRKRLIERNTDKKFQIQIRLQEAKREMECAVWYDYVVVNKTIRESVEQLEAIIMAQRLKVMPGDNFGPGCRENCNNECGCS